MSRSFLRRRMIQAVIVLIGASMLAFIVLRLIPGDPALLMLRENASQEEIDATRAAMGLDRPVVVQYIDFMKKMAVGDFGVSLRRGVPVSRLIREHLPATVLLAFSALGIALVISIPLGLVAGIRHNSAFDYATSVVTLLGQSMPSFWLGMMLILVFSVNLRLLPTSGTGSLKHLILPSVTLAVYHLALTTRLMRSSVLEVAREDYVRTARAKGLGESKVLYNHIFRNAVIPTITMVGLDLGNLLGGAIITESLFSWPGIGFLTVQAITFRDYPVVQGLVFLSAVTFVVINLLVDILLSLVDPRIDITS